MDEQERDEYERTIDTLNQEKNELLHELGILRRDIGVIARELGCEPILVHIAVEVTHLKIFKRDVLKNLPAEIEAVIMRYDTAKER